MKLIVFLIINNSPPEWFDLSKRTMWKPFGVESDSNNSQRNQVSRFWPLKAVEKEANSDAQCEEHLDQTQYVVVGPESMDPPGNREFKLQIEEDTSTYIS